MTAVRCGRMLAARQKGLAIATIPSTTRWLHPAQGRTPMLHQVTHRTTNSHHPGPATLSRRTILRGGMALTWALTAPNVSIPAGAQAAMAIRVAAPQILDKDDCQVSVSVTVTLMHVPSTKRYAVSGDILEWDTDTEDAAFCCSLGAQDILVTSGRTQQVTLTQQTTAVDLGLVRGMGPSADERYSPDLVELFARMSLRDLATGKVLGPWDSPQRVAVSRSPFSWQVREPLPHNPLMAPRVSAPAVGVGPEGRTWPPQPCGS